MPTPPGVSDPADVLSVAVESLGRLSSESSFDQWLGALAKAGFALAFESHSHEGAWPEALDPMGPPPAPKSIAETRRHAILAHPAGFAITLASGPGQAGPEGDSDESLRPLKELVIHHQTDLGASISDLRRGEFGSGGTTGLGDGTRVYTGFERLGSSPGALISFLKACYREARPTPLAQWGESTFFSVEHGLFSPTPSDCAFGGPNYAPIRERFAERLERDWSSFLSALPPELAVRVSATGVPRGSGGPKRPTFRYAESTQKYWALQLKTLGQNWPNDRDSSIMASWTASIDRARSDKSGLVAFEFENAHERVVGGANPLHAIACFFTHPVDAKPAVDAARVWLDAQTEADLQTWLSQRDARGLTPAGVAFEVWMRDGALGREEKEVPRVIDLFLERGWLGAPGEFAQIAHDILSPQPARWSMTVTPAELGHAIAFDRVERAAARAGREWLVPLRTETGVAATRVEAIEALVGKFGAAKAETRAYLEALALRSEISPAPRPAALGEPSDSAPQPPAAPRASRALL